VRELVVVRAGHVFDSERSLGSTSVLIEDGVIMDVDTSGAQPPEGATLVDFGAEACVLPGLIDAHVHLAFHATADLVEPLARADDEALLLHMHSAAAQALRAGVTTVRDLGDRGYLSLSLREGGPGEPAF
jgi:imidazolonepropionase-like amidohydrolase